MAKKGVRRIPARLRFAENLRSIRTQKGLSQEDLADLVNLHRTYVGSVERGERNISVDNMEALADALGVELSEMLRG
ncbi:helix-turn-helix domain-containing protein [Geothrix edaphica]|uniref:helix-turn-helix domain-containing protein n=1 Tax=Geothrix edaphica TaxID=2927976 RepID=UPI00255707EF|nr:helix-turn-helix transcriptional regulator [Geothrix edaphica]